MKWILVLVLLAGCKTSIATVEFDEYQCRFLQQRQVNTTVLCKRPPNGGKTSSEGSPSVSSNRTSTGKAPSGDKGTPAPPRGTGGGIEGGGSNGGGRPPGGGGSIGGGGGSPGGGGEEINVDPPDRMGDHTNYPNRPSDCCEPKNP